MKTDSAIRRTPRLAIGISLLAISLSLIASIIVTSCGGGGGGAPPPPSSSAKAITAYSLNGATGTIDEANKTIAVTMPYGTSVTGLVAAFTFTGNSISVGGVTQVSGTTANSFTNPVTYTVTAADGSSVNYAVTVTVAQGPKAITAYSLNGATGTIDEANKTIAVTMPYGTSVTALVATFTTTGASVKVGTITQVSGVTPNDFTSPVAYVVTAVDSTTATYSVLVYEGIRLPKTGQTVSQDIKTIKTDDGALQRGAVWPTPRFIDNSDGTIKDNLTGLMWLKDANCIKTQYPTFDSDGFAGDGAVFKLHAYDFVAGLNTGTYSLCAAGKTGWRVPNIVELRSLINYGESDNAAWLSTQGFINVASSSASAFHFSSTAYKVIFMETGSESAYPGINGVFVWPVRSVPGFFTQTALPQTGQTTVNVPGDDGEQKAGVAWPSPRFSATSSAAGTIVTDNLTGLMWPADASYSSTYQWYGALSHVDYLNANNYLGYNDWRMPNVLELVSLLHAEFSKEICGGAPCTSNASWLNSQGFINFQAASYWSSTPTPYGYAWLVTMNKGGLNTYPKSLYSSFLNVIPVRGGL